MVIYLYQQDIPIYVFLPDDKADIIAASLLISYCSFSSLIWSLIVMILYYTIALNRIAFKRIYNEWNCILYQKGFF